jgi:hypothetical protein
VNNRLSQKILYYIALITLGLLAVFLITELIFSFQWRMVHDAPILYYIAFLIDKHGYIPYKDIFEQSTPGTYLFHLAIGKALGYEDSSFQIANAVCFILIFGATWLLMKPFGKMVAWASALTFGLLYFSFGPSMMLQRDYIGLLPIALALVLATKKTHSTQLDIKSFAIGALFGLSASIKPHLGMGLPVLILYLTSEHKNIDLKNFALQFLRYSFLAAFGFIIIFSLPLLWVWSTGGFPYFWQIFSTYLPLYLHVNGESVAMSGLQRWLYLLNSYLQFGGQPLMVIFSVLGGYFILSNKDEEYYQRKNIYLLFVLLLIYSIYPVLSGKFWPYHWIPFFYFASLCISLLLRSVSRPFTAKNAVSLALFLIFLLTTIRPASDFVLQISGQPPKPLQRVDFIVDFLQRKLRPGDKVQPLDTVLGDVIQGILVSKALIATPYIYDYQFYHDISNPYIQGLRGDFMQDMEKEKPRFIIEYIDRPRPSGEDTTTTFTAFDEFLQTNYEIRVVNKKVRIYERK